MPSSFCALYNSVSKPDTQSFCNYRVGKKEPVSLWLYSRCTIGGWSFTNRNYWFLTDFINEWWKERESKGPSQVKFGTGTDSEIAVQFTIKLII